jgi:hypothetical protein
MTARDRARRFGRTVAALIALGAVALTVMACATTEVAGQSFPAPSIGPGMTVTPAVNGTRADLVRVLGDQQLVLTDTQAPVRPAEAPLLGAAPRAVYQVSLPKDPDKGYIIVYEFPDPARAAAAASEQQAWLGSGPGRVQRPQGTITIIRQVGSTVVYYDWLPGASRDPSAAGIQTALETLGTGYPVPN